MNYAKFVDAHTSVTTKICEVLVDTNMTAEEGELILLWLAGLSLGKRQVSMTKSSEYLTMLALGWQVGAGDTDD